jgi:hypothetical protein
VCASVRGVQAITFDDTVVGAVTCFVVTACTKAAAMLYAFNPALALWLAVLIVVCNALLRYAVARARSAAAPAFNVAMDRRCFERPLFFPPFPRI